MRKRKSLDQAAVAAVEWILDAPTLTDQDRVSAIRGAIKEHHRLQGVRYVLPGH